jgi:hypothetical protein
MACRLGQLIGGAVARQAVRDGQAQVAEDALESALQANSWEPVYLPYERLAVRV